MNRLSREAHYLLGHTSTELDRLDLQGMLYRPATRRAFEGAGLDRGMRVLDVGCGTGDVSMLAAELVGPQGSVVGIDRGPDAVAAARRNAGGRGLANVEFQATEIAAFRDGASFDALVGRFVLMHQQEPADVLQHASRSVRSGGIVCILESYMDALLTGAHSCPHSPLYDRIVRWKSAVVRGAGADLHAGARLRQVFAAAGLPAPTVRMETRLEGGPDSPYYEYLARSMASMMPEATRLGLDSLEPSDPHELAALLRDEVSQSGGVLLAWPIVAAWSRVA